MQVSFLAIKENLKLNTNLLVKAWYVYMFL